MSRKNCVGRGKRKENITMRQRRRKMIARAKERKKKKKKKASRRASGAAYLEMGDERPNGQAPET